MTGGELSENDTVATRSFVVGGEPAASVAVLDGKVPGSVTVCPKAAALTRVSYDRGQATTVDGGAGVRDLTVTVRRPNADDHVAEATLAHGDSLELPEPVLVDEGIEIVAVMRSGDGSRLDGAEWGLAYGFDCV